MNKETISITVSVDGNEVTRNFAYDEFEKILWSVEIRDMVQTIEQSEDKVF